jgi:hypothetical protein
MARLLETRQTVAPSMTNAVLNFCAAAALIALFSEDPGEYLLHTSGPAILAGALVFLAACVLVFVKPRLSHALCLAAGLTVLSAFVRSQIAREPYNSWIALNFSTPLGNFPYAIARGRHWWSVF